MARLDLETHAAIEKNGRRCRKGGDGRSPFKVGKCAPGYSTSLDAFRPAHAESKGWRHAIEWIKRGSEHIGEENLVGAGGCVAGTAVDENHYLAVATSPPAGWRIEAGESGHFGIGWHAESHHDAGMSAARECRDQGGGSACSFNASGTSLRGGCVGLAMASWRDRDKEPERTYVATSSSFRDLIARDLRAGCGSTAFSGKHEDTVVEHSCEIVRIMCAGDGISADRTSDA